MFRSNKPFVLLVIVCLFTMSLFTAFAQEQPVTVTFMINQNEFTEQERLAFMEANPGITVEMIPEDYTRLKAMFAAGNPPDVIRLWDHMVPELVTNGLLYDLTDAVAANPSFARDNLADAVEGFIINERLYGIPKDWSPLFLYINKNLFETVGLDIPSTETPLTYAEVAELARQLTVMEGNRVLQIGFAYDNIGIDRDLQRVSMERGINLFSDDFSAINLTNNPAAMDYMRMIFELSQARATFSILNPTTGWWGQDFLEGRVAMVPTGYWFQGFISSAQDASVTPDDVTILPLPSQSGVRLNPLGGVVGTAISASTRQFDAAYALFEYYNAGAPAEARASSGWGVPALNSLVSLIPDTTDLQQQAVAALESELVYATTRYVVNPYISGGSINTVLNSLMDRALNGELTFEQAMQMAEDEINLVIEDGMIAAGVK